MHSRIIGSDDACIASNASHTDVYTCQASVPSIVRPAMP